LRVVHKDRGWIRPLRIVTKGHAYGIFTSVKAVAVVLATTRDVAARNKTNKGERRECRELSLATRRLHT